MKVIIEIVLHMDTVIQDFGLRNHLKNSSRTLLDYLNMRDFDEPPLTGASLPAKARVKARLVPKQFDYLNQII